MAAVKELLRAEEDGSISFGNYELNSKTKLADFKHLGDTYKVKTFSEITKLEKNEMFVYESVPGTAVHNMKQGGDKLSFEVEGPEDAQITVEMETDSEYEVAINGAEAGRIKTNLGGKLSFSVELGEATASVVIMKL